MISDSDDNDAINECASDALSDCDNAVSDCPKDDTVLEYLKVYKFVKHIHFFNNQ